MSARTSLLSLPNVLISSSLKRRILMRSSARRILSDLTFSALNCGERPGEFGLGRGLDQTRVSEGVRPSHSVLLMPSVDI